VFEIMAFTKKNEDAVSPVIGVILMVAITVILAAVIAAFVFGMAGNISKTKVVAVTAQKSDSSDITVMNQGGQDQSALTAINATTPGIVFTCKDSTGNVLPIVSGSCQLTAPAVGNTIKMTSTTAAAYGARTEVVVTGTFNDGTNQVLLDTFI
jgi:flagellin-like protein